VTAVRPGIIAWLLFMASRNLPRQVVELRSADGLLAATLSVARGPGAWRESLARDRAQAKRYAASSIFAQSEQADPGSASYGGRKSVCLSHIERVGGSWRVSMTAYIWDMNTPAILSIRADRTPRVPGTESERDALVAGPRAFDFSAVRP
jgi:hypothetical protein